MLNDVYTINTYLYIIFINLLVLSPVFSQPEVLPMMWVSPTTPSPTPTCQRHVTYRRVKAPNTRYLARGRDNDEYDDVIVVIEA